MENYQQGDDRIILLKNPYNYGKIKIEVKQLNSQKENIF